MRNKLLILGLVSMMGSLYAMSPSSPSLGSPGEGSMRQRGMGRDLFSVGVQLNPLIYEIMPRPQVHPPYLNLPVSSIVIDWFYSKINAGQISFLNKIVEARSARRRVVLTQDESNLFDNFPLLVQDRVKHYLDFSNIELDATVVVPSEDDLPAAPATPRSKKRKK